MKNMIDIRKKWNKNEIKFLIENYNENGCKFICEKLNRTKGSVAQKAKQFNLSVKYKPNINKEELEIAVKKSYCFSNLIDNLGKTKTGASMKIVRKHIEYYNLDISHFDRYKKTKEILRKKYSRNNLDVWLINGSTINSSNLKCKLYKYNLKQRKCELCSQDENWNGKKMSLILDHINGIHNDNRLENLRIVCPNCNATLDTHCRGSKKIKNCNKNLKKEILNNEKIINGGRTNNQMKSSENQRKVKRPTVDDLKKDIYELGYSGTGRKYGVSDNAIRKWIK